MQKRYSLEVGAETLVFETGKIAKQANGAVRAQYGETIVLTTACIADTARKGIDFFPLLVDFEERFYSAGKIPGGFIKREGRPSETAVLSSRVVDRSIRSLFEDEMRHDVHVVTTVLAVDQVHLPNVLAINAASAALTISDIPWSGPVGAVRMGRVDGNLLVNPTEQQMESSDLDLLVAGHADGITMVESGSRELSEETLIDALEIAHGEIRKIVDLQLRMREEIGREKMVLPRPERIPEIDEWMHRELGGDIRTAVKIHEKKPRNDALRDAKTRALDYFQDRFDDCGEYVAAMMESMV